MRPDLQKTSFFFIFVDGFLYGGCSAVPSRFLALHVAQLSPGGKLTKRAPFAAALKTNIKYATKQTLEADLEKRPMHTLRWRRSKLQFKIVVPKLTVQKVQFRVYRSRFGIHDLQMRIYSSQVTVHKLYATTYNLEPAARNVVSKIYKFQRESYNLHKEISNSRYQLANSKTKFPPHFRRTDQFPITDFHRGQSLEVSFLGPVRKQQIANSKQRRANSTQGGGVGGEGPTLT